MGGTLSDTTGATQYRLVISSVVLARTSRTSSNFSLSSSTGGFGVQSSMASSIVNAQPNYIQNISLTIGTLPSQLNQYERLSLRIRTFNGINMLDGQYLVIQIPTLFTYGNFTGTICQTTIFNCTRFNNDNYMIRVAASTTYSTLGLVNDFTITLNQLMYVSPTFFQFNTDYFYVTSYTNNNRMIDTTDPISVAASKATFYLSCNGRCATCPDSNTSYCNTCYTSTYVGVLSNVTYGGFNTMTSDRLCVDVCGDGYFNNSGICQLCISPCLKCNSSTVCTSCVLNYFYVDSTSTCVSVCPTTPNFTYADSTTRICANCSSNCKRCANISVNCT